MIATIAAMLLLGMGQASVPQVPPPPAPRSTGPTPPLFRPLAPPPPPPRTSWPPRPLAPLAGLISRSDYPPIALRYREEGDVAYRVTVGLDGRVKQCVITASSGSSLLDAATCRLITSRARFAPGRSLDGKPIAATYSARARWRIDEQAEPPPMPPPIVRTVPPPILYAPPAPPPPPPPPRTGRPQPARAKANLASLISDEDYPASAIRNREEGSVGFRLAVAPNGRVSDCAITQSSGSVTLDATTCRILTSRSRFTPARDESGEPVSDTVYGRIVWRLVNDFDRPWEPALFVEEMRSVAGGAVTCWQGWPPGRLWPESCPGAEAASFAARARAVGTGLEQSIVTWLTPEGMADVADRPGRGTPFYAADGTFTIAPDGKLVECRLTRNEYLGRDRSRGTPPDRCADWDVGTNKLYVANPGGPAARKVKVTIRGYVGPASTPAPEPLTGPPIMVPRPPPISIRIPPSAQAPGPVIAELNWRTCIEDRARRLALDAVSRRESPPGAEAALAACAEQESRLRTALAASGDSTASWTARRETAAREAQGLIETIWREHNYD